MACTIALINPTKNKVVKTKTLNESYKEIILNKTIQSLNEELNKKTNKKELFWKVIVIGV